MERSPAPRHGVPRPGNHTRGLFPLLKQPQGISAALLCQGAPVEARQPPQRRPAAPHSAAGHHGENPHGHPQQRGPAKGQAPLPATRAPLPACEELDKVLWVTAALPCDTPAVGEDAHSVAAPEDRNSPSHCDQRPANLQPGRGSLTHRSERANRLWARQPRAGSDAGCNGCQRIDPVPPA